MRRSFVLLATWISIVGVVAIAGCGSAASGRLSAPPAARVIAWRTVVHVSRPLDLAGPRADGSQVLAAGGRLWLLRRSGAVEPFAPGYRSPGGEEPYIALSRGGCFGAGTVYALRLHSGRGVAAISAVGAVRVFARIDAPGLIDGIAFDRTGKFGRPLLVTVNHGSTTTVVALDCHGHLSTITRSAPRVEGGIAVAPARFGRFAGDLIATGETSGKVFAVTPAGKSLLVANSGLPHGGDVGVESAGFVPAGRDLEAFLADRRTPGNRHPGDDVVLGLPAGELRLAGVRPGDLLVATEGGAFVDAIRCGQAGCRVRHVANGPAIAHGEGHIAFGLPIR